MKKQLQHTIPTNRKTWLACEGDVMVGRLQSSINIELGFTYNEDIDTGT